MGSAPVISLSWNWWIKFHTNSVNITLVVCLQFSIGWDHFVFAPSRGHFELCEMKSHHPLISISLETKANNVAALTSPGLYDVKWSPKCVRTFSDKTCKAFIFSLQGITSHVVKCDLQTHFGNIFQQCNKNGIYLIQSRPWLWNYLSWLCFFPLIEAGFPVLASINNATADQFRAANVAQLSNCSLKDVKGSYKASLLADPWEEMAGIWTLEEKELE